MSEQCLRCAVHESTEWTCTCDGDCGHPLCAEKRANCESSIVLYPDVEQIDLYCELPAGHEGRHRDGDSTWEADSYGLGDSETHRYDGEPG